MSNCQVFNLPALEAEIYQVREALRCLLHTIIFNRALGYVRPRDVDSELFSDITFVTCGDPEVHATIEARLSEFVALLEKRQQGQDTAQLCLSFFEKRRRQAGWFGAADERLYWEQWRMHVVVVQPDVFTQDHHALECTNARQLRTARLQAQLREALSAIVAAVNERRDHIPPVTASSTITFPFDISMSAGSRSSFGLGAVKRMIMHASPPPMLS